MQRTEFEGVILGLRHQYHSAAAFPVAACPDRHLADFELVDPVMQGSKSVRIITEAQCKFTMNFSNLHLSEMEKFDDCALVEFRPERGMLNISNFQSPFSTS
jgi:hypothetical protein